MNPIETKLQTHDIAFTIPKPGGVSRSALGILLSSSESKGPEVDMRIERLVHHDGEADVYIFLSVSQTLLHPLPSFLYGKANGIRFLSLATITRQQGSRYCAPGDDPRGENPMMVFLRLQTR
jgi:hypothetical protein